MKLIISLLGMMVLLGTAGCHHGHYRGGSYDDSPSGHYGHDGHDRYGQYGSYDHRYDRYGRYYGRNYRTYDSRYGPYYYDGYYYR